MAMVSACSVGSIDARGGLTFDSLNLSLQAAIAGVGVGIAIRALVTEELATGQLVQPFGPSRISSRPFFLTYPSRRSHDRRLVAFSTWLMREACTARFDSR
jgi:LysR family transcriptional regulator, glycine cleavage system transcriptional activator